MSEKHNEGLAEMRGFFNGKTNAIILFCKKLRWHMTWQGVPFPIFVDQIAASAHLAIEKIPKVYVDTGDNSWGIAATMIATILGSLIAGSIPAYIAWKTIQKNQEATEIDRATQQASFDKDREAQIEIASKNFNAQVLSANRQAWINEFRNNISEFIASMDDYVISFYNIAESKRLFEHYAEYYESLESPNSAAIDGMNQRTLAYRDARREKDRQAREANKIFTKTVLMLNPKEASSAVITDIMKKLMIHPLQITQKEEVIHSDIYDTLYRLSNDLVNVVQMCLKAEWEKTKVGQ